MQKSKTTIEELAKHVPQIMKKRSCDNRNVRKKFGNYSSKLYHMEAKS